MTEDQKREIARVHGVIKHYVTPETEAVWDTYLFEYTFGGQTWCCELKAQSFKDAERRVLAIGRSGRVYGRLDGTIPFEWPSIPERLWHWCKRRLLVILHT